MNYFRERKSVFIRFQCLEYAAVSSLLPCQVHLRVHRHVYDPEAEGFVEK